MYVLYNVHLNVGKLVLKIPWKNLYTEPVIAKLEGLYIVAAPNIGNFLCSWCMPYGNFAVWVNTLSLCGVSLKCICGVLGVQYNEQKEAKNAWDKKQKELQRIEDSKKAEALAKCNRNYI